MYPSAFRLLAESPRDGPSGRRGSLPACGRVSVNLVTHDHVDVPFHNDREVGVVGHAFEPGVSPSPEAFQAELDSSTVGVRRL